MPRPARERRAGGSAAYGIATGVAAAIAVAAAGGDLEISAGVLVAWSLQWPALGALASALDEGRDATRAWLGGLASRALGLAATVGLMLAGRAGESLPIAYGAAMWAFLMAEAAWLYRRLPERPRRTTASPAEDAMERGRTVG